MSVAIRLRQEGSKGRPIYRIVAADKRYRRDGRFLEILGSYDPARKDNKAEVNLERVDAWIANGAQPSDTVRSLINKARAAAQA
ncbi:MAG TPA: 30S ribosomal protein S16 [Verrucomicrobiales bacterium]|nr:30S ribosomal protein S16 [Verrucomicrobiales bacterium]HRJ08136.1 30S ribosomal protein S16 [Prosthecobacter sp.]HRK13791.1 30S ribosomal protein S16 [Prosthecobacter sp.]